MTVMAGSDGMRNAQVIDRLVEREYRVTLDFVEPLLGSRPTASVARRWVEAQERDALAREIRRTGQPSGAVNANGVAEHTRVDADSAVALADERIAASTGADTGRDEAGDNLAVTGFSADDEGRLHLWDFQLKGYLKAAAETLDLKIPGKRADAISARAQIQRMVWVFGTGSANPMDRRLYLLRDGQPLHAPDGLLDRPLRAMTAQGERVAIAVSEQVEPPCACGLRLVLLKGCRISDEQIDDLFGYALFQGLGQWRSGGWGRADATVERTR